jgi:PAS domain S-box-containing protein
MVDLLSQPEFAEAWAGGASAFRALAESLGQCVSLFDREGRCVAVNQPLSRWLGRPEGEIRGRTVFDLWPRSFAEREAAENQRVLWGERVENDSERPREGQPIPVRVLKAPVRDDEGAVRGVLCLFQEARPERQASKMELLGRLTSGIVHDFNNLLAVQLNNLALLQASVPPGTALEEYLQALRKSINQGAALTDRLLMMVRKGSRGFRAVDLNDICTDATELLRHSMSPRIALEVRLRPELPPIFADAGQVMQVLMNLCFNARDAMPHGGRLVIETEERTVADPSSTLHSSLRASQLSYVCLHVCDTGDGISPEVRPHIFDPFFTTKHSGQSTGLGLSIVQEIVQRVEGWIDCHSTVGQGTRFTVWLPAAVPSHTVPSGAEEVPEGPDITPSPSHSLGQDTILVADNEPSIIHLTQTILQRAGYRVLSAEDGRQALEIYRQKKGGIDLVILDENMPGLSGLETMNELLAINAEVRVLLVTGGSLPEPSWRRGMPGWGFLAKPYTVDQLVQSVRQVLTAKSPR